jgi:uncharacterized protein with HEPN domain
MRDDIRRLEDIQEAIEKIEKHRSEGRSKFDRDEMLQVWITHHLGIIGEAAANISEATRSQYPDVPWKSIIGMRNILVHRYFGIDLNPVWQAAAVASHPLNPD